MTDLTDRPILLVDDDTGLLEALLDIGGVALPWDRSRVRPLPEAMITPMMRDRFGPR